MSSQFYNDALMQRAKSGRGKGRLPDPKSTATLDNPLCGDRVTIDLQWRGETLAAVGHEVKGCVLCEAAAALIAEIFPGKIRKEIEEGCAAAASLMAEGTHPRESWSSLLLFEPVHGVRSRRNCVMLPFLAVRKALSGS